MRDWVYWGPTQSRWIMYMTGAPKGRQYYTYAQSVPEAKELFTAWVAQVDPGDGSLHRSLCRAALHPFYGGFPAGPGSSMAEWSPFDSPLVHFAMTQQGFAITSTNRGIKY